MRRHPNSPFRIILIDPPEDVDVEPLIDRMFVNNPTNVDIVTLSTGQADVEAEVRRLVLRAASAGAFDVVVWGKGVRATAGHIFLNGSHSGLAELIVERGWTVAPSDGSFRVYLYPESQVSAGHMGVIEYDAAQGKFKGRVTLPSASGFELVNPNNGNGIGHMVRTTNVGSNDNGFPNHCESWHWSSTSWPSTFRLRNPSSSLRVRADQGTWEMVDLGPFPTAATGNGIESGTDWSWWKISYDDGNTQTPVGYLQRNASTGKQRWFGKVSLLHVDGSNKRWLKMTDQDDSLLFESTSPLSAIPSGHVDVTTTVQST